MYSRKATPQGPPKDGGIMRFFSATPKQLNPVDGFASSPSATGAASVSAVKSLASPPKGEDQKMTDNVAPPNLTTPVLPRALATEDQHDEGFKKASEPASLAPAATPKSSSAAASSTQKAGKSESKGSKSERKSKSMASAKAKRRVLMDDDDEEEGAAGAADSSSSSDSESSASESSGSSSDDFSSDSSSSSSSSSSGDDDDASESDTPKRKGGAKKGLKAAPSMTKGKAALSGSDEDEDAAAGSPQKKARPSAGGKGTVSLADMNAFKVKPAVAALTPGKPFAGFASGSTPLRAGGSAAPSPGAAAFKPKPSPKPAAAKGRDDDDDGDDEGSGGDGDDDDDQNKPAALAAGDYSFPAFSQAPARRDAQGRRPEDPAFDPRTLHIPESELKRMTPAQRQYWEIKAQNMDVLLFFKMGKFYELFDMDAEVGIRELNLARMGGDRLHAGFPESAYGKYAEVLVKRGYKVGRVEQTQTPKQLQEANAKAAKGQKSSVVRREMCSILTQATITDQDLLGRDDAVYLLSLCERQLHAGVEAAAAAAAASAAATRDPSAETFARVAFVAEDVLVGVCFTDTATGVFNVGSFVDDRQRSRLRTLLACIKPAEVLYARDGLTPATAGALKADLAPTALRTVLTPGAEFWAADRTLAELSKGRYFDEARAKRERDVARELPPLVAEDGWPFLLDALRTQTLTGAPADAAGADASADSVARRKAAGEMLFSALGGATWYLRRLLLDAELLSLGNFRRYDPAVQAEFDSLVLDGQTLQNLEILYNQDGGSEGTLLKHLDQCVTPFGRRLMRHWVARPLGRVAAINERLDAVEELMAAREAVASARAAMKKLPDLERMLSRVRANGTKKDDAVMFENVGKAKIELFIKTLDGFASALQAVAALGQQEWRSSRLRALTRVRSKEYPEGAFPEVATLLSDFKGTFNAAQARVDGFIVPQAGFVEEYDAAKASVTACERELDDYLKEVREFFRDSSIKYHHRAKEVYQLEVSVETLKRVKPPHEYEQMSQTQKVRRFWTSSVRALVAELETAQERRDAVLQDVTRQVFAKFGLDYPLWAQAVACVAELDCIISLALVSAFQDGASCRPQFLSYADSQGRAVLELRDAVHPSLAQTGASLGAYAHAPTQFIPNDTDLGTAVNPSRFVLISGPNMGGKSTLLRQVCCAVIMAQIGCYVAAKGCRLTPVDRIFTRVGANDRIMQGQSTFLVELEETATILRHASPRSLVILDELGRGTSTFDGTAIAHAVIEYLTDRVGCLSLFSTHYHMLLEEFRHDARVSMYHMACQVRARTGAAAGGAAAAVAANADDTRAAVEDGDNVDVTFLYKFIPGVCSKSFGMNVATLAGLPRPLVMRAKAMSELFEQRLQLAHKVVPADGAETTPAATGAGEAPRTADSADGLAALARRLMAALTLKNRHELESIRAQVRAALA